MNNFTGFNPQEAKNDLVKFNNELCEIIDMQSNALHILFDDLFWIWASPKAKEFSDKYDPICETLTENTNAEGSKILKAVAQAIDKMAEGNGYQPFAFADIDYPYGNFSPALLCEELNGIVGMNISLAKDAFESF